MSERPPQILETEAREEGGRVVYEMASAGPGAGGPGGPGTPISLWTKVRFWLIVVAGLAAGVALFLLALTFFLYVVLPVVAVLLIWRWLQRTFSGGAGYSGSR